MTHRNLEKEPTHKPQPLDAGKPAVVTDGGQAADEADSREAGALPAARSSHAKKPAVARTALLAERSVCEALVANAAALRAVGVDGPALATTASEAARLLGLYQRLQNSADRAYQAYQARVTHARPQEERLALAARSFAPGSSLANDFDSYVSRRAELLGVGRRVATVKRKKKPAGGGATPATGGSSAPPTRA